jgi:hypothetical protein
MKETWKRGSGIQKLDGKRYHSLPTQMFTVRRVPGQKREESTLVSNRPRKEERDGIAATKRAARARGGSGTVSGKRQIGVGAILQLVVIQVVVDVQRRLEVDALSQATSTRTHEM